MHMITHCDRIYVNIAANYTSTVAHVSDGNLYSCDEGSKSFKLFDDLRRRSEYCWCLFLHDFTECMNYLAGNATFQLGGLRG